MSTRIHLADSAAEDTEVRASFNGDDAVTFPVTNSIADVPDQYVAQFLSAFEGSYVLDDGNTDAGE